MYGFHKIPHLQQGVLRAESDTEFWNFEHPHFLRGQPDLLCLIQRKKQAPTTGDDAHVAPAANKDAATNGAVGTLSANQLLDMNSIVNGIQVIKRHQAAISADLNELKSSNQHLWQEAMVARERHKKHQDTINRIVKFLAGVFGHAENQMRKDEDGPHAVLARKPQRLMISDGRSGKKVDVNEIVEEESRSSMESERSTNSMNGASCYGVSSIVFLTSHSGLFGSSMDAPSVQLSEPLATPRFASVEPSVSDAPTPPAPEPRPAPQETRPTPSAPSSDPSIPAPLQTSTTTTSPSQTTNDHIVQTALASVLNSPSQMQKLLAALAAQSISPEVLPPAGQSYHQQHLIAPSPYNNPHQFTPNLASNIHPNPTTPSQLPATIDYTTANALSPFTLSLLGAPSEPDPFVLQQQDERFQKTYESTMEIDNDVDELQNNIQSLLQGLGIDPASLESGIHPPETATGDGGGGATSAPLSTGDVDMFSHVNMGAGQDFDFDAFLMDMPRANEEDVDLDKLAEKLDPSTAVVRKVTDTSKIGKTSPEELHAFLDEVASRDGSEGVGGGVPQLQTHTFKVPSGAVSAVGVEQATGTGGRGRKRKSDVIADNAHTYGPLGTTTAAATTVASSISNNKSKRKR